jgi:hypothetical protein
MSIRSAMPALGAALLFRASTPLAKLLAGEILPFLLAGLLYLGSGLGRCLSVLLRHLQKSKNIRQHQPEDAVGRRSLAASWWLCGSLESRARGIFSIAPLFGVIISFLLWPQTPDLLLWLAAALMGFGVWRHVRERQEHEHTHTPLERGHSHHHDEHHQHPHTFAGAGTGAHAHAHRHEALAHKHPHYPDIHHQHLHPHLR